MRRILFRPPMFRAATLRKDGQAAPLAVVPRRSWFLAVKGLVDRIAALLLLVPALPLMGLLVLAIRATSPGPGIYKQRRVGRGGMLFTMYKLRSMRIDAETRSGPVWSAAHHDPRVTPLGFWLRRLHLDELPQLFNVLRGEMSLVGPRPERPEFVHILAEQIPGYLDRLEVHCGITGLAQVNLPPDTDLESVRKKLVLDAEYIESASFWLDLRILSCTAVRVLGLRGGRAVRMFCLQRNVVLPPEQVAGATSPPVAVPACDKPETPRETVAVVTEA